MYYPLAEYYQTLHLVLVKFLAQTLVFYVKLFILRVMFDLAAVTLQFATRINKVLYVGQSFKHPVFLHNKNTFRISMSSILIYALSYSEEPDSNSIDLPSLMFKLRDRIKLFQSHFRLH